MQSSQIRKPEVRGAYYPGLDILKFVLAFFVLAEHVPIMSSLSGMGLRIGTAVLSPAVDIFFAISGFLCVDRVMHLPEGDRMAAMERRFLASGKTILLLYVAWSVIYFPLNAVLSFAAGDFDAHTIVPWIVNYVRIFIFSGMWVYAPHLWYLLALGLGFLILHWCVKRRIPIVWVFTASAVLSAIGSAMPWLVRHSPLIDIVYRHTFADTRNVVFTGMLYICCGVLLALHKDRLRVPSPALWLGAALSLAGLTSAHGITWTICSVAFVTLIIALTSRYSRTYAYPSLRLWGVIIYLLHVYVLKVAQFLILRLGFVIIDVNVTCLIFSSIGALLLALALAPLIRRHRSLRFLFHG